MLSGSAKIMGHRLTRFKNRQVFVKLKKFNQSRSYVPNGKQSLNDFSKYNTMNNRPAPFWVIFIKIFSVAVISVVFLMAFLFINEGINNAEVEALRKIEIKKIQKIHDLKFLVGSGFSNLKEKRFNSAQGEFILALKLDEYNRDANIGLLQVLIKQCKLKGQFCKDLKEREEFNLKSNYVSEKQLETWFED